MKTQTVLKIQEIDFTTTSEVTTGDVVLEALCAMRDRLIMSDNPAVDTNDKLLLLHMAIGDIAEQLK